MRKKKRTKPWLNRLRLKIHFNTFWSWSRSFTIHLYKSWLSSWYSSIVGRFAVALFFFLSFCSSFAIYTSMMVSCRTKTKSKDKTMYPHLPIIIILFILFCIVRSLLVFFFFFCYFIRPTWLSIYLLKHFYSIYLSVACQFCVFGTFDVFYFGVRSLENNIVNGVDGMEFHRSQVTMLIESKASKRSDCYKHRAYTTHTHSVVWKRKKSDFFSSTFIRSILNLISQRKLNIRI